MDSLVRICNRMAHQYPTLNFKETHGLIINHVLPLEKEYLICREYIRSKKIDNKSIMDASIMR